MKEHRMAGKGSSSQKPSSSNPSSQKKSRWESGNPPPDSALKPKHSSVPTVDSLPGASSKLPRDQLPPPVPIPVRPSAGSPFALPDPGGPPPPAYGFHMLERRTIVLADGSVRSYFALPPDYPEFTPPGRYTDPSAEKFFPYGPGGGHETGGLGIGFDKHYPPPGRLSPDGSRRDRDRDELYGRGGPPQDYWKSLGLDGRGPPPPESPLKRKYGDGEGRDGRDEFARQRQQLLQYGNPNRNEFPSGERSDYMAGTSSPFRRGPLESGRGGMDDLRPSKHMRSGADGYDDLPSSGQGLTGNDVAGSVGAKHSDVNPHLLKRAFLHFTKTLNENVSERKNYLENGKYGALRCLICDRDSKEYMDVHGLIMHTYNSQNARAEHLGLHKALCVLMGWNYMRVPDNSKAYRSLSENEAAANKEDVIIWPPIVVIHTMNTGKRKDGHMDYISNKEMDNTLKELGFGGGKSEWTKGKDGHVVKFANSQSGLDEAERLAEIFEKDNHGRKGWAHVQASQSGDDDENKKAGDKKRILYGYLGLASDLDKVDFNTRKKTLIKSRREFDLSW